LDFQPDIILADYKLPTYDGTQALQALKSIAPLVPYIVVTGTLGEEKTVELMRNGAVDYVLKDRLARLPEAIRNALEKAESNRQRKEVQQKLIESEAMLREAQAISHIGSWCWELADDRIHWSEESCLILGLEHDCGSHDLISFIETIVFEEDRSRVKRQFEDARTGRSEYKCEFRIRRLDGNIRWVQGHGKLILDGEGKPLRLSGTNLDITERKEAEIERTGMLNKIERNLMQFVSAFTRVVEQRDPYTAGHQFRVADLAFAIAKEMGVDAHRSKGVHLAGMMHDIGKISIPAEILSKPGRLNEIEYMMVRMHAEAGYQILKGIDFPWPIADMVRQHHERIDGTGYPLKLKGEEILLEGRILAVADVVEAMSSHRPYRAGLGMETALKEISSHKGDQFDQAVVEACIRLFKEKGFTFSEAAGRDLID
jgi:PAS domain S-box-containing protein/putative nucleotidyltransferase with HDIG domain